MVNMPVQIDNLVYDSQHHWVMGHVILPVIIFNQNPNIVEGEFRLAVFNGVMGRQVFEQGAAVMISLD